ncbi:MAG: hypothetical protein JXA44_02815 [Methanospirillaceae archaeon]|nr:hypothetical protein [Methanospirillaceae archaeon]
MDWSNLSAHVFWISLCIAILILPVSGALEAFPVIPAECYGNVTIDGIPAPPGTTITAIQAEHIVGTITISTSGTYGSSGVFGDRLYLIPPQPREQDEQAGLIISFLIGSIPAGETLPFKPGTCTPLDLSAYSKNPAQAQTSPEKSFPDNNAGSVLTLHIRDCNLVTESVAVIPVSSLCIARGVSG